MRRLLILSISSIVLLACAAIASQAPNVTLRVDLRAETADIINNGDESLNLRGWTLVSVTGGQRFTLPNVTLPAKDTVTITSGGDARDDPPRYIRWTRRNVCNNDGDPGQLFDASRNLVARTR